MGRIFHRNGHYRLVTKVDLGLTAQAFQTSRCYVAKQMTEDKEQSFG